jgi:hypothetical protein
MLCTGVDCEDPDALEHLLARLGGAKSEFALGAAAASARPVSRIWRVL